MEFIINEYHRDIPDEELLDDLRRVAVSLKKENLSMPEYQKNGKYHPSTIARRFGGWRNSIKKAGLSLTKPYAKHEYCENELLFFEDMRFVASKLNREYITMGDYKQQGRFDIKALFRKYGSWNALLQMAGLKPTPFRLGKGKEILDEELFQDIERVWIKLGRQPTIKDVKNGEFIFAQNTFTRRFGGWRKTLEAFVNYINTNDTNDTEILNDTIDENSNINISNENEPLHNYKHRTKREPSNRLKVQVLMRDGNRCRICGVACNDGIHKINFDHIKPWSKGGETTLENLQVLCSICNDALGNLDK